jgi:hypothetical protein
VAVGLNEEFADDLDLRCVVLESAIGKMMNQSR